MLAPWKKSYDKPRQHIKKQRRYFANRGPFSQSFGFSSILYGCEFECNFPDYVIRTWRTKGLGRRNVK